MPRLEAKMTRVHCVDELPRDVNKQGQGQNTGRTLPQVWGTVGLKEPKLGVDDKQSIQVTVHFNMPGY